MIQYFKEILTTFSITQRIWALIILCVAVFFITFGSNIIEVIKPDPTQQNLVVKRQKKQIRYLNTQLDSLTIRVDDLTQEVIDGQSECTRKRIEREKEIIAQIDEIENMVRNGGRVHQMIKKSGQNSQIDSIQIARSENTNEVYDDRTGEIIEGLCNLKNKIKNKK
jgi:cell division protein FtsB